MIETVKIGLIRYDVHEADRHNAPPDVFKSENVDDWVLGEIFYGKAKIYIDDEQSEQTKPTTLMHEILHGILVQAGQYKANENEGLINALSFSLVQLIRDNPELVAYLTR